MISERVKDRQGKGQGQGSGMSSEGSEMSKERQ